MFSTLDLTSAYHQMRMAENSSKFTAFRTHDEIYECLVVLMGLTGKPGSWSRLMSQLFGTPTFLNFVVVYLDDICVFSKSAQDYIQHSHAVFEVLRDNKLFVRVDKCVFLASQISFLGYVVSSSGLDADPWEVDAVVQWPEPRAKRTCNASSVSLGTSDASLQASQVVYCR